MEKKQSQQHNISARDNNGGLASLGTSTDVGIVNVWLHNRPPLTAKAYRTDATAFLAFVGKPIMSVTLPDLQFYADSLTGQAATRNRKLSAIKSLFAAAQTAGFIQLNPAAALRLSRADDSGAEHILTEAECNRLIATETDPDLHLALRTLYELGLRRSELVGLKWHDLRPAARGSKLGGSARVIGKGGKERHAGIEKGLWGAVDAHRGQPAEPVFRRRGGQPLGEDALYRAFKRGAARIGQPEASPHWFRHSAVSHALDRGVPAHDVMRQVGHGDLKTTTRYAHSREGVSLAGSPRSTRP